MNIGGFSYHLIWSESQSDHSVQFLADTDS